MFGLHRDTVRKMLVFSVPPGYLRQSPPKRPKLEPFTGVIDRILEDDLGRPRKQRHTAKRIFERLREEYRFDGQYTIVKDYVREHRGTLISPRLGSQVDEPPRGGGVPFWSTHRLTPQAQSSLSSRQGGRRAGAIPGALEYPRCRRCRRRGGCWPGARLLTLHLPKRWPWGGKVSRALARLRAIPLPA